MARKKTKGQLKEKATKQARRQAYHPDPVTLQLGTPECNGQTIGQAKGTLLLKDFKGATRVQRFSPSSLDKEKQLEKELKQGLELKNKCYEVIEVHQRHHANVIHLGVWSQYGHLVYTKQHSQHEEVAGKMLKWASRFFNDFIYVRKPWIAPDLLEALEKRWGGFEVMQARLGRVNTQVLHAWWAMLALFDGISPGAHVDKKDAWPSIMVNFGKEVDLVLPDWNCKIRMHHGDIVFFDSCSLTHSTDGDGEGRWAMGFFTRKIITMPDMYEAPTTIKGLQKELQQNVLPANYFTKS